LNKQAKTGTIIKSFVWCY